MEERRSTWQIWHVRAEAQRQVRAVELQAEQSERLVDLLVGDVLGNLSVSLARPNDGITEPAVLRRSDGTSVYTVAGSELFTSTRILDAEQRLVDTAGRYDGHTISPAAVDAALLQATANGVTLNAGQVALVRQMATSGARLQLAIAPAGTGKTTAMQTLAAAWTEAGGNCDRARAVSGRRRPAPRPDQRPHRHPRQTHLVRSTTTTCPTGPGGLGRRPWW